jgi:hypothetical protein
VGVFCRGGSVMYFICSEGKRGVLGSKVGVLGYEVRMVLTMESKAAFVHLNCIVHSAARRGRACNSREQKLYLLLS